ncbi:MAG TPA: TOPRIM nucleotidyl transferase/hydrolase domain-containing protein [Streptosporangiaceae bacterium]
MDPGLRRLLTAAAEPGRPAAVVLVEGASDRAALTVLARRQGQDLTADGIRVAEMGGATNLGHFLEVLGPAGLGVPLAGLCDAAEAPVFRRALDRAGLAPGLTLAGLPRAGFFVCQADLEDELIRALGPAGVRDVIAAQGELRSLRRFQDQPAQRDRELTAQLRRFLGTRSGRKAQYARLLAEAVELTLMPAPLAGVLGYARRAAASAETARPARPEP